MLDELGAALRETREHRGVSLQAIAEPSQISATYLQKLERGGVGSPSPHVLRRIGSSLGLPYLRLMELAGYLDATEAKAATQRRDSSPRPHPLAGQQLSQDEWRAVGAFIKTLKSQRAGRG